MTDVFTVIETADWSLFSDTTAPAGPGSTGRQLVGPLVANWSIDVLPPIATPSSVAFQIWDDGTNPSGFLPVDIGTPVGVYVTDQDYADPLLAFQGRVVDISARNTHRGGVIFTLICTDRLSDLAAEPTQRTVLGKAPQTGIPGGLPALFYAYQQLTARAGIDFDWTSVGGLPDWVYANRMTFDNATVLDALSLYIAHDIRAGVSAWLSFDVDPADPTPIADVEYSLVAYDPAGISDLAGSLELFYDGTEYILAVNDDYYVDHDGIVLRAGELAFDVGDWQKTRQAALNSVELTGAFIQPERYPSSVGEPFRGAQTAPTSVAVSPNLKALPTGIQEGDKAWAFITASTAVIADPVAAPAGWELHSSTPLQQSSTVRGWLYTADVSSLDDGTVPVWTLQNASAWAIVGGVVTDTDGIDPFVPGVDPGVIPNTNTANAASGLAFTVAGVDPLRPYSLLFGVVAGRAGTGATVTVTGIPAGWTPIADFQGGLTTNRMGLYAFQRQRANGNALGEQTGAFSLTGTNNGVSIAFSFMPQYTDDSVRREHGSLVAAYGVNGRQLASPLYYVTDAERVGDVLLGPLDQVQLGYGISALTLAWELLDPDAKAAWGSLLWPCGGADPLGRPVAVIDIPDSWRLVDGPAVFGRLMGVQLQVDGDQVRVGFALRAVAGNLDGSITYTGIGAFTFPSVRFNNLDPSITFDQLRLVED